jgi:N-dimethylarginine dimethylaminohydrolase
MCPPNYFGVEYEINPWMKRDQPPDHALAVRQWNDLRQMLTDAGARVLLQKPVRGLPDLVFTANAALIYGRAAMLARFRYPERQGEEPFDAKWLEDSGFHVHRLPNDVYFEGAGDALFCGDTLFAGYRIRSDVRGLQQIGELFRCRVIALELIDPYYYHLDTCFCPLSPGVAVYFPEAFDQYARDVLSELIPELIPVAEVEARRFACNAVVIRRTVVTNTGCPNLHRELQQRGFTPRETKLDEFAKAGGSAKCLTLRLDGEEAANWRQNR